MREFFRGWKRKAGCVTLILACALMAGWMRSLQISDLRVIQRKNSTRIDRLTSSNGLLTWESFQWDSMDTLAILDNVSNNMLFSQSFDAKTRSRINRVVRLYPEDYQPQIQCWGFEFGVQLLSDHIRMESLIIPYWLVVLPTTLLSAYLLLSKPRVK